jgi:glyoxylase-like metal-dependent hydrolase (beta-lactamase superfamily II)
MTGILGASLIPRRTHGRAPEDSTPLAATRLAPHVLLVRGAGGNVVVVSQPEELLIVNGGVAERAPSLTALVDREFPGQRARVLFNTDWHPEHTGLNASQGLAGVRIIAHENTKLWLGTEVSVRWANRIHKPLPPQALPSETFYTTGTLTFGSERVEYAHLGQAHTDGDIYVFLPASNILIAGDVVTVGSYPVLDYSTGGWIGGMVTATRALLAVARADTQIVPGDGPVQTRAHLQAEHDMLAATRDRLVKMMKSGLSVDEMLAGAPTREFDPVWGDPERFIRNAYPGLWGHVRELGGVI